MTPEQLSFDSFTPRDNSEEPIVRTDDKPRTMQKLGGNWLEENAKRIDDINKLRGKDLKKEQTGIPSVEPEEPELPRILEDEGLNRLWHIEQAEHAQAVQRNIGAKTIKAAQKSAAKHVAKHRRMRGEERKINRRT